MLVVFCFFDSMYWLLMQLTTSTPLKKSLCLSSSIYTQTLFHDICIRETTRGQDQKRGLQESFVIVLCIIVWILV